MEKKKSYVLPAYLRQSMYGNGSLTPESLRSTATSSSMRSSEDSGLDLQASMPSKVLNRRIVGTRSINGKKHKSESSDDGASDKESGYNLRSKKTPSRKSNTGSSDEDSETVKSTKKHSRKRVSDSEREDDDVETIAPANEPEAKKAARTQAPVAAVVAFQYVAAPPQQNKSAEDLEKDGLGRLKKDFNNTSNFKRLTLFERPPEVVIVNQPFASFELAKVKAPKPPPSKRSILVDDSTSSSGDSSDSDSESRPKPAAVPPVDESNVENKVSDETDSNKQVQILRLNQNDNPQTSKPANGPAPKTTVPVSGPDPKRNEKQKQKVNVTSSDDDSDSDSSDDDSYTDDSDDSDDSDYEEKKKPSSRGSAKMSPNIVPVSTVAEPANDDSSRQPSRDTRTATIRVGSGKGASPPSTSDTSTTKPAVPSADQKKKPAAAQKNSQVGVSEKQKQKSGPPPRKPETAKPAAANTRSSNTSSAAAAASATKKSIPSSQPKLSKPSSNGKSKGK